jgi:hypothetical protein
MKRLVLSILGKLQLYFGRIDFATKQVASRPKDAEIPKKTVIIVGQQGFQKWALMRCPCGCNEVLSQSLMKKKLPSWRLEIDRWNRITLSPSIWKNDGCRSHFFIKKGRLIWCKD